MKPLVTPFVCMYIDFLHVLVACHDGKMSFCPQSIAIYQLLGFLLDACSWSTDREVNLKKQQRLQLFPVPGSVAWWAGQLF